LLVSLLKRDYYFSKLNDEIMSDSSIDEELKRRAIDEIVAETARAAVRAEVGVGGWLKPSHRGLNKRFLNNTLVSTISSNCRLDKTTPLKKAVRKESGSIANHQINKKEPKKVIGKIKVSNKSRFQAYLEAKKRESAREEKEKSEPDTKTQVAEQGNTEAESTEKQT